MFYAVLHYTNITFPIKLERFYLLYGKCQIIKQPYISSTLSLFLLVSLKTGVQKKISNKQLSFEPPYKRLSCVPFNSSHVYIRAQFPLGIHFVNCKHSGLIHRRNTPCNKAGRLPDLQKENERKKRK